MRRLAGWVLVAVAAAGIRVGSEGAAPPQTVVTGQAGREAPAPPAKGTGLVTGQVVDAYGAGVPAAIVLLQGGYQPIALTTDNRAIPGGPRYTITTDDGRFAFFDLTPGTYAFDANKAGYVAGAYGRLRPGGQPQSIDLKDGEVQTGLRITVWEYASVAGALRDEAGEPVVGVQVRALKRSLISGRWLWASAPSSTTNDRGEYRIDALLPGRYIVVLASTQSTVPLATSAASPDVQLQLIRAGVSGSVTSGRAVGDWLWSSGSRSAMTVPDPTADGRLLVYPTTFYPSARSARDAEAIALESGQDLRGVDLQLQLVPTAIVSGVVMGPDGPASGLPVRLAPDYADELAGDLRGLEAAVTISDVSGRFLFAGVPVSKYVLQAELQPAPAPGAPGPSANAPGGWANDPITVGEAGIFDMALVLKPTVTVSGRIAFDGTKPPPSPDLVSRFVVSLETIGFAVRRVEAPYSATLDRDGRFVIARVPPGQYVATFRAAIADRRAMPDWETQGVTLDGRDVSDHPMTISHDITGMVVTLTDHNNELGGTVRDSGGRADPTAAVLLFTAERDLWPMRMNRRIRMLRASESGVYSVRGVPPGDYFILAVPDPEVGDYPDVSMLEVLRRLATPFAMALGEHKTIDLTVRSIKAAR